MKKTYLVLALFLSGFAAQSANAQLLGFDIGGYGSYIKPQDLDKGTGYGGVFRGQLLEFIGYDARAGYFTFDDPSVDMVPLEGSVFLRMPLPFMALYGGGGAGYYMFSGEEGFSLDNEWGFFPMAGIEAHLGPVLVFAEWRYLFLEPEISSSGGGFTRGNDLDFSGSSFTLGVTYRF